MYKFFSSFLCSCLLASLLYGNGGKINFNVKDFGALGDGRHLDSKAINKAIDAAAKAGGGTVFFPAGNYLSGSIHLQSNVGLYIDHGASIIAAPPGKQNEYDPAEEPGAGNAYQDFGHSHWQNSLIWGVDLHDISIAGPGRIWGKGLIRSDKDVNEKYAGNKAISLLRCRNVIIRDISILEGGWFAILATGVDNFTLDNVKMDTNRDGVDIDCCKNVRVSNCTVNSPMDDGICLKSSYALGYARSTENVTITNCQVSGFDVGTLLDGTYKKTYIASRGRYPIGRIKFGTESNGGFKNITISNCVFEHCRGLALESVDGALLEDVTINNITMRDIGNDPIFIRLGSRMRGPEELKVGAIRRVIISNIVVYDGKSPYACTISGIPNHPIEDIQLSNIRLYYQGTVSGDHSADPVPEAENSYPEPGIFGPNPANSFFIRHVKNIKLTDVECIGLAPDGRPAIRMDDVEGVYIHHLTLPHESGPYPLLLNNVKDISIYQSRGIANQENKTGATLSLE